MRHSSTHTYTGCSTTWPFQIPWLFPDLKKLSLILSNISRVAAYSFKSRAYEQRFLTDTPNDKAKYLIIYILSWLLTHIFYPVLFLFGIYSTLQAAGDKKNLRKKLSNFFPDLISNCLTFPCILWLLSTLHRVQDKHSSPHYIVMHTHKSCTHINRARI